MENQQKFSELKLDGPFIQASSLGYRWIELILVDGHIPLNNIGEWLSTMEKAKEDYKQKHNGLDC